MIDDGIINENYKYSELTAKIIGAAIEVHRTLGNGFQEVVDQRALAIEMWETGLSFERELEMGIFYKGQKIGARRVDFFVEGKSCGGNKSFNCFGRRSFNASNEDN